MTLSNYNFPGVSGSESVGLINAITAQLPDFQPFYPLDLLAENDGLERGTALPPYVHQRLVKRDSTPFRDLGSPDIDMLPQEG